MATFKKSLLAVAAVAALMTGATAAQAAQKIKIATEGAFPPFSAMSKEGKAIGFDVDIANALCAEMKVECQVVTQDWDGIIPGLLAKKYDAIVSSMSITDERKKAVDFTDPYYSNKLQFVAKKGVDYTLTADGLKGKAVGAQRATISAEWMEKNMPGIETKLYGTQEEAFLDLAAGRTDVVLNDVYVTYDWLQSDAGKAFEYKGKVVYDDDKIGIAVRKNDALREKLNAAIKVIRANGTYAKINAKYFPFDIY
ncbi:ABC transporter substrate-binding protein [Novispirillum itersonii]|uniref:ABC transporter substrate-binding protein n=1 Tax=Novispirillum itersonii TaxID=189 RepID=UPI00036F86DC|nr:ABC transporter substrate-binding protein [Novispirillum itersonii]